MFSLFVFALSVVGFSLASGVLFSLLLQKGEPSDAKEKIFPIVSDRYLSIINELHIDKTFEQLEKAS